MPSNLIVEDWLEYTTGTTSGPDTAASVPTTDPNSPPPMQQPDPNVANAEPSEDPQTPDMPEEKDEHMDYEQWKKKFVESTIKGDIQEMKDLILQVRDRDLDTYQRKFVEDNLQIVFLREQSNIDKASKEIRKATKEDLDHNNPGTSIVNHLVEVLNTVPTLNNVFIKLTGLYSMKADLHRKFIGALLGAVQVGSGGSTEDLVFNEKDYSVRISTRCNARFGDFSIGSWKLRADDPQRYLKPPELQRLEDGSPEEKAVLRKRIYLESIAETFKTRAFIMNVIGTDGTIYTIGWDIATSLKSAYTEGRLVVKIKDDGDTETMIDDDGEIVKFPDMKIMFVKQTGELDEEGKPFKREVEFITKRNGLLTLDAQLHTIKEASSSFPGLVIRETPYSGGNPSDLKVLQRCIPSAVEILMRQCG